MNCEKLLISDIPRPPIFSLELARAALEQNKALFESSTRDNHHKSTLCDIVCDAESQNGFQFLPNIFQKLHCCCGVDSQAAVVMFGVPAQRDKDNRGGFV